jgi:hypothetical protein
MEIGKLLTTKFRDDSWITTAVFAKGDIGKDASLQFSIQ